jgi:hypothetical protein
MGSDSGWVELNKTASPRPVNHQTDVLPALRYLGLPGLPAPRRMLATWYIMLGITPAEREDEEWNTGWPGFMKPTEGAT